MFFSHLFGGKAAPKDYLGYEIDYARNAAGFMFRTGKDVEYVRMPYKELRPLLQLDVRVPVEIKQGGYCVPFDDLKVTGRSLMCAQKTPRPHAEPVHAAPCEAAPSLQLLTA